MEDFEKKFSIEKIKSNETFEPEKQLTEIKKQVRRAPVYEQSNFRRELMKEWREKFIKQRLGLTQIQNEIEDKICQNPDIEFRHLLQIVKNRRQEYELSEEQYQNFEKAINTYLAKHQAIKNQIENYQKKYPKNWQNELFKDLLGQYPKGQVDLEILPMNLFWKCHNIHDFALIYRDDSENIKGLDEITGCCRIKGKIKSLEYLSIAANLTAEKTDKDVENTARHEERHEILHQLFPPTSADFDFEFDWRTIIPQKRDKVIQKTIYQYLENYRQIYARQAAQREILAYLISGRDWIDIDKRLRKPTSKNYYDYFKNFPEDIEAMIKHRLGPIYKVFKFDFRKMTEQLVKKTRQFHHQEVDDGLEAVRELEKMPEFFNNRQKLVAFLSTEPLHKWLRLVKMLKEAI